MDGCLDLYVGFKNLQGCCEGFLYQKVYKELILLRMMMKFLLLKKIFEGRKGDLLLIIKSLNSEQRLQGAVKNYWLFKIKFVALLNIYLRLFGNGKCIIFFNNDLKNLFITAIFLKFFEVYCVG